MSQADALAHIDAAIAALSYDESIRINCATGAETQTPALERCISEDLAHLDRQLLPKGIVPRTLLGAHAECMKQAFLELHAARLALRPKGGSTLADSDGDDSA